VWGVLAGAIAVGLVRGGFFAAGQYAFAGVAAVGVAVLVAGFAGWERRALRDPVLVGLVMVALANVVAGAASGRADAIAPTLVACALPVLYILARLPPASPTPAALIVAISATSAFAGVGALLLHANPEAERIAGIWRAGGTFEYPPALAVACVCGLACVLGLAASGDIARTTGLVLAGLLCIAIALTYDRAGGLMAVGVLLLFGRVVGGRRLLMVAAMAALVATASVLVLARPHLTQIERHLRHGPITSRSDTWSDAWRAIRRRPTLGYGPGGYPRIYAHGGDRTRTERAHDTVLEQTVEAGVAAGLGAAVVTIAGLARAIPALRSRHPAKLTWACVATAIIISGIYDFTLSYPPVTAIGLVALARLAHERDIASRP
jgi:O-antigen ligase